MAFDVASLKPARPEAFILPVHFVRLETRSGPVRRNVRKSSQMGEQLSPD
jgi:hypothetical protein